MAALLNVRSALTGLVSTRGLGAFLGDPIAPVAALAQNPLPLPVAFRAPPLAPDSVGVAPGYYARPDLMDVLTAYDLRGMHNQTRLGAY